MIFTLIPNKNFYPGKLLSRRNTISMIKVSNEFNKITYCQ